MRTTTDTAPSSGSMGRRKKDERAFTAYQTPPILSTRTNKKKRDGGGGRRGDTINDITMSVVTVKIMVARKNLTSPPCLRLETLRAPAAAAGPTGPTDRSDRSDRYHPFASAAAAAAPAAPAAAAVVARFQEPRTSPPAEPSSSSPQGPCRARPSPCAPFPSCPGPKTCMCPAPLRAPSAMAPCQTPSSARCAGLCGISNSGCIFFCVFVHAARRGGQSKGFLESQRQRWLTAPVPRSPAAHPAATNRT